MPPFYQQPDFTFPPIVQSLKDYYQRDSFKVQWAFSECRFAEWGAGRRDAEGYLQLSIEALRDNVPEEVNEDYIKFLARYLHLLLVWTANDHGYILNDPERTFVKFLNNPVAYAAFSELDQEGKVLAWLCVSAAAPIVDLADATTNALVRALVHRMTNGEQPQTAVVTTQSTVDALYGPACWDLYSPGGVADIASILWDNGVPVFKHLNLGDDRSILPTDLIWPD